MSGIIIIIIIKSMYNEDRDVDSTHQLGEEKKKRIIAYLA